LNKSQLRHFDFGLEGRPDQRDITYWRVQTNIRMISGTYKKGFR